MLRRLDPWILIGRNVSKTFQNCTLTGNVTHLFVLGVENTKFIVSKWWNVRVWGRAT